MTLVGEPSVGIVYKTKKGTTYTEWYHHQGIGSHTPVDVWLKDMLYFNRIYSQIHPKDINKIMAVVRQK